MIYDCFSMGIAPTTNSNTSNTSTTTPTTTTTTSTTNPPDAFSDFMTRMFTGMASGQTNTSQPPEERYRSQLEQLSSMGFINREQNLQGK